MWSNALFSALFLFVIEIEKQQFTYYLFVLVVPLRNTIRQKSEEEMRKITFDVAGIVYCVFSESKIGNIKNVSLNQQ